MIGNYNYGTGRRKSAVARVFIKAGTGQIIVNASGRTPELNKGAVSSCAEDRQRARPGALPRSQKLSRSILGGVSCKEVAPFLSDFPKYPKALEARSSAKPVDLLTISLPQSGDTQRQLTAPSTSPWQTEHSLGVSATCLGCPARGISQGSTL